MPNQADTNALPPFGSEDLRLPDDCAAVARAHRGPAAAYLQRLGGRVGFGSGRPWSSSTWPASGSTPGSRSAATSTRSSRRPARCWRRPAAAQSRSSSPPTPTTRPHPPSPHDRKLKLEPAADAGDLFELDPRLERRPTREDRPQALRLGLQGDEPARDAHRRWASTR